MTGATGWLGRAVSELLADALGLEESQKRLGLFASRERELRLDAGFVAPIRQLSELPRWEHDVLLHYAFLTRERLAEVGLDAYVRTNLEITGSAVKAIERSRPAAVVYASSGAIYEADGSLATDIGKSPYGTLKHFDELALRGAAADGGGRSVVLRVFNVAGPWIRKPSSFVISDLISQAIAEQPLVVKASTPMMRSYVDVADLAEIAVASALERALDGDLVLDTAGAEVVEVGALADRVAALIGSAGADIQRSWDPAAEPDRYVGDGVALRRLADSLGIVLRGLDEQIERTAAALRALS